MGFRVWGLGFRAFGFGVKGFAGLRVDLPFTTENRGDVADYMASLFF